MTPEEREQLFRLASHIQVEQDPETFCKLIAELNELLARTEEPIRFSYRSVEEHRSAEA